MGNFSLLLRAPFVALVFEQSESTDYWIGALPCLAAVLALAIVLRRRMIALGKPAAAATLVATTMSAMTDEGLRYCVTYLVWALPLTGWLMLAVFAPERLEVLSVRARFVADHPAGATPATS